MIEIPQTGFKLSVNQSNVDTTALADWLETTTLFDEPELSKGDVVDTLLDQQICTNENQEVAHSIASDGWYELSRRKRWGGVSDAVSITDSRITVSEEWGKDPLRSFLVLLSALRIYPEWARDFSQYSVQGDLFERVVEHLCPALLPDWNVFRTGWSGNRTSRFPIIFSELTTRLFMRGAADPSVWLSSAVKDAGLDLVCYRSYEDQREALPVFLLQCASGGNWITKVNSPSADLWHKILDSAVTPSTGIVAPFVIDEKELRLAGVTGQCVVFDRLRLLSAAQKNKIEMADSLVDDLLSWILPRAKGLPRAV